MTQIGTEPLESEGFVVDGFEVTPEMIAVAGRILLREECIWYNLGIGGAAHLAEEIIRAVLLAKPRGKPEAP